MRSEFDVALVAERLGIAAVNNENLFDEMVSNLSNVGYSIHTNALPNTLGKSLWVQSHDSACSSLKAAGIGRQSDLKIDQSVRSDKIAWIDSSTSIGCEWVAWAAELQRKLNSSLYLGLFSFESHYALYHPGGFYKTHVDAFKGSRNRILSLVIYLNHSWLAADAGELVLFTEGELKVPVKVKPEFGTVVAFLSEEIPHEVLVTNRDRYSIAGWFCANREIP